MSYTNGIGVPLQLPNAPELASTSNTSKAAKTEAGSVSLLAHNTPTINLLVDDAKLSTAAGAVAQALSGSDVRTEKVAALQQSIAAGTYNVSSSDVADKLISALLK